MRYRRLLLLGLSLLLGSSFAVALPLKLTVTAGFNGYYRPGVLLPIAVQITNTGEDLNGEFKVTPVEPTTLADSYRFPAFIPQRRQPVALPLCAAHRVLA